MIFWCRDQDAVLCHMVGRIRDVKNQKYGRLLPFVVK